jgi:hypothetical protein
MRNLWLSVGLMAAAAVAAPADAEAAKRKPKKSQAQVAGFVQSSGGPGRASGRRHDGSRFDVAAFFEHIQMKSGGP